MQRVVTGRQRDRADRMRTAIARFYAALSRCGSPRQARKPAAAPDPAAKAAAQADRRERYDGFVLSL